MSGRAFARYEDAIASSRADLVWISTVNSRHAELARLALDAGRHVVIDKPATTSLDDTKDLVDIARRRRLVLAEATTYPFHPQIAAARKVFDDAGSSPAQIVAMFSFPELPPTNFRNDPALGGGMLLDLGPYAMSLGRVFFDAAPVEIVSRNLAGDRGFSVLATYPGERTVTGHFGMTTGYMNRLTLLGPRVTLAMERAFTTTADTTCRLQAVIANAPVTVEVPPADSFACFIKDVLAAIERGDTGPFLATMLADAQALAQLRGHR
jgi:predicted dehydrogenase